MVFPIDYFRFNQIKKPRAFRCPRLVLAQKNVQRGQPQGKGLSKNHHQREFVGAIALMDVMIIALLKLMVPAYVSYHRIVKQHLPMTLKNS